jgi:hypothetical protein
MPSLREINKYASVKEMRHVHSCYIRNELSSYCLTSLADSGKPVNMQFCRPSVADLHLKTTEILSRVGQTVQLEILH